MSVPLLMVARCTVQHRKVRCLRVCAENKKNAQAHTRTCPMLKPSSRARLKLMPCSEQTDYVFSATVTLGSVFLRASMTHKAVTNHTSASRAFGPYSVVGHNYRLPCVR